MGRVNVVPIQFNVTPDVRDEIQRKADEAGMEMSAYIQSLIQAQTGLQWEISRQHRRKKKEETTSG